MRICVTGSSGNAGIAVCAALAAAGFDVRRADVAPPPGRSEAGFVRCDTRSPADARVAVAGCDAVVHLAAWHCAHQPPVSDATIFAVNVDGTYNVLEACREHRVGAVVFASSMAYGWGSIYSASKVLGEDLWRCYHEMTGAAVASLRYHAFVPGPYLEYGARLLRNGVDREDIAAATVAALRAALERRIGLFTTIVHTRHGMPEDVRRDFARLGPGWCEQRLPGATSLMARYALDLPREVEQYDLGEAQRLLGWTPRVGFIEFLRDLAARDARGEDVRRLVVPGGLPNDAAAIAAAD